ncbi:MAG TPA: VCBS repeat-containing protein [Xanthobacteraceae bacterium]|nr:VCBS repeat-containing protein [Xanthobacteraceae bacterium]
MPNNLSGQVDLVAAIEGTALASNTDVASFTDGTTSDTAADFTATIDWGDGVTTTGTVVGSNGSFTVEGGHTYADDDFVTPVVTVTRTTDSSQIVLFGGVNVADADNLAGQSAPTLVASPGQALTNVVVATFSDTYTGHPDGSDFTVNIDWGDGTTTAGTLTGSGGAFTVTGSHTYASAGNFTITTFMADDSPDASFASAITQADIGFGGTEVLSAATETVAVAAGTTVATFADNAGLPSSDYTATIDWGDGTTTAGVVSGSGGSFTVASAVDHTYADEGQFTEVVTITRTTDNATIAPSGTVTVADTDSLSGSGRTIKGDPNVALTNVTVATFTDSNTASGPGEFVATIDWGDGTTTTGTVSGGSGAFTVDGSHTYTQNGQDAIAVTVSENPGNPEATAFVSVGSTALIGIAPVSGGSININEGQAVPAGSLVATFSDSNNSDTAASFTASIDWGDGTTTAGTVTGGLGSFSVTGGPHTYTGAAGDEGGDTVTTTLTRISDNDSATATGAVFIGESDHFAVTGTAVSGSQGTLLNNVQVATFTDTYTGHPDGSDFTALIDWGDGTGQTLGTVSGSGGSFTVDGSHTYANAGNDTITVDVLDNGGTATASGTSTATIAARTLAGTMVLTAAVEAAALPGNTVVATFTDTITRDTAGDFTATIDWGDGNTTTGTVVGSNGSFTVEGGHTYGDEGSDPAVVTLIHTSDSASATASGSVAVAEADLLTGHGETIRPHANVPFSGEVATFSDTNTANVAGDFTATINWGDGTTTTGTVTGGSGTLTVDGTHTYTHPGHESITVTLADDTPGTATATASSTANVNNAKNDFNGDGKSDVLFQTTVGPIFAGGLQVDFMNGTSVAAQGEVPAPGLLSHVVGSGDFNGDGKADIVFQSIDGTPQIWTMNGATVTSETTLANPGATWRAVGTGDFTGTGQSDIVFQNIDGTPMIDMMNGTSIASSVKLADPGAQWKLVAASDFNGDGKSDLLFEKGNGALTVWEMNGTSVTATATIASPGAQWKLIGTGDFNGDGNSDLLFQKGNGTPMIEMLNGTSVVSTTVLANPGATWQAIGTGDYNGDGKSDILFQKNDGTPMVWIMNGTSVTASATLPNPGILAHANTG